MSNPRGGPPSKLAKVNEASQESGGPVRQRHSPETEDPEARARRVARRLSQETAPQRSRSNSQDTNPDAGETTEAAAGRDNADNSDDIIVVDDVIQEAASRGRLDSINSTTGAVGNVQIADSSDQRQSRPATAGRAFPSGDDARREADAASGQPAERTGGAGGARDRPQFGQELNTCPEHVLVTRVAKPEVYRQVDVLANFVQQSPMPDRRIYQYRVEFEPEIESRAQRRWFWHEAVKNLFSKKPGFDGMHDIYCAQKLDEKVTIQTVQHPQNQGEKVSLTITNVGDIDWSSHQMMRVYGLHMKKFLGEMGFYQITVAGSWVHSDLSTGIADGRILSMVRGFKTSHHRYDGDRILVQMEPVHKLMQRRNVLQVMSDIKNQKPNNLREALHGELVGKLVITNYNKRVYRIEDVRFDVRPSGTFLDKKENKQISYVDYYQRRYALQVTDVNQPMLQVVPNNKRGKNERGKEDQTNEIFLIPELCNITGLTEQQRNDNRLKMDLIRSSQVAPTERVQQLRDFLRLFHANVNVREALREWGYTYEPEPVKLKAHVLPVTKIGGERGMNTVHPQTADFNINELARVPQLDKLIIMTTRVDMGDKSTILGNLRKGFEKVNLRPRDVVQVDVTAGDAPSHYIAELRRLQHDMTAIVVVMHNQNKEKYDAIKKIASVERGIVTQCITAKLMTDQRKAASAATKIAIQVAAKIGGEPWWADMPLKKAMICGYDTSRDTAKRGVSYGAFLASMNDQYSRWYSRADSHEQLDQVSTQLSECMIEALTKYKELNGCYPQRVFVYRDGVGEGGLNVVFHTESKGIIDVVKKIDPEIKLTFIVVNKRVGARFYLHVANNKQFTNPPPGTVIDHTVTREKRYDFYLISQSTRQGSISPTYYNIIHDESGMQVQHHQMMAYKLSLLYYNWTGTVRVPAPCQYAHKLAQLCGEHLHAQPNSVLSDRLHFL